MSFEGSEPQATVDTTTAPTTNGNTTFTDSMVNNASAAVNAVQNHPITQNVANGPVAQSVKNQSAATSNEFSGLANSRAPPSHTAANGQPLTHYHSFFYTLLSWEHPRATGISFAAAVLLIFAGRYLPILRYVFKMSFMTLGVVAVAELAGKYVMGTGVVTSMRPRRYYQIPKETLEASVEDFSQLVNFFVIEFQRILFAENVPATIAAFVASFVSYYLIKFLPLWGLTLISTCIVFLGPLVYIQNKELIDGQLEHASGVINAQATQVKDLTAHHTSKGIESVKAYTGDYAAKASDLVGSARQKIPTPATAKREPTSSTSINENSFPNAPNSDLPSGAAAETSKPSVYAPTEGEPIAAYSA